MAKERERILVVESDPMVGDLIARQALGSLGVEVRIAEEAATALKEAAAFKPDVVIANLELPGLSGKDLMAALASQNVTVPVIMIAEKGQEKDVIQAFRLGASDQISAPVREAEVVSAVERALKTVRARKERKQLSQQLQSANVELKQRVNELTTIFAVGKAVTSITDQDNLFDEIIKGAVKITQADYGWLLIQDEESKEYILRAHQNLPKSLSSQMGKAWDDGISSLVAVSGETFSIHGEAIRRFKIGSLGKSALVAPVKVQRQNVALMVVMRKADREFGASDQAMLEAVSDYASISLVNARLFRALDERASSLMQAVEQSRDSEKLKDEIIQNVSHELRTPLESAKGYIDKLAAGEIGKLDEKQREALDKSQEKLDRIVEILQVMDMLYETASPKNQTTFPINALVKDIVENYKKLAQTRNIELKTNLPPNPVPVYADAEQISLALEALLSNAVKFSLEGNPVIVSVSQREDGYAHVSVLDQGIGINKKHQALIFDRFYQVDGATTPRFEGLGIGLALVKEIITAHGGDVWVESHPDQGANFHIALPPVNALAG